MATTLSVPTALSESELTTLLQSRPKDGSYGGKPYANIDPMYSEVTCVVTDIDSMDATSSISTDYPMFGPSLSGGSRGVSFDSYQGDILGPSLSGGSRGVSFDSYQGDILGWEFTEQDSLQATNTHASRGLSLDSIDEDLLDDVIIESKKPLSPVLESPDPQRSLALSSTTSDSSKPPSPNSSSLSLAVLVGPPGLELIPQQVVCEKTTSSLIFTPHLSPSESSEPMSAALPSVGSADHGSGTCQPCNFFWKPQGCINGAECRHCHICPPGEVKVRQKARHAAKKPLPAPRVAYEKVAAVTPDGAATIASEFGRIPDVWQGMAAPPSCTLPSRGAVLHMAGRCKPCGWFWKSDGCQNGAECGFCHLCPESAIKDRKKQRHRIMFGAMQKSGKSLEPVKLQGLCGA